MNKKSTAISIGVMCFVLTMAVAVQLNTVKSNNIRMSQNITENRLRDEVLKWKERYEQVYKQVQDKEIELDNQRSRATQNDESSKELQNKLENLQRRLGYTDLNGKGIIIKLDDNKTVTSDMVIDISDYIVHDKDIMLVINELKAGGAEAISVNGQRIVSSSKIMCVGPTIMINDQKLAAPYEIKAIGYPEALESVINLQGGYGEELRSYGLTLEVEKKDNVTIYKYAGLIESKNLQTIE